MTSQKPIAPSRFFRLTALAAAILALAPNFSFAASPAYEFHHAAKGLKTGTLAGGTPSDSGGQNPGPSTPMPTYTATVSTNSLAFGSLRVGGTKDLGVSLLNTGTDVLTLAVPTVSSGYVITTNCGVTLAPGNSCDSAIQFRPTAVQEYPGTATFGSNAVGSPLQVALTGAGAMATGTLTADTSSDFGIVNTGQSAQRSFTFKNTGTVSAPQTYAQVNKAELSIATNTCGTSAAPVEVAAGATCTVTVKYAPTAQSTLTGASVSVASQATGSPFSVVLTGSAGVVDAASASVTFLLHAEGSLSDASSSRLTMSTTGTASAGTKRSRFGTGALQLDGSTATAVTTVTNGFGFGKGDFTIEAWVYLEDGQPANSTVMDFRASGYFSQSKPTIFSFAGKLQYYTNGGVPASMSANVTSNAWHHVAYSRSAGVGRFFVDGAQAGSNFADGNDYGASSDLILGQVGDVRNYAPGYFKGSIDEVRVTKGVGRYLSNFAVPAAAFPNP